MRRHVSWLLLGALVLTQSRPLHAQAEVRGLFFRNEDRGFQVWLPQGFERTEDKAIDSQGGSYETVATFGSHCPGLFDIRLVWTKYQDVAEFGESLKKGFEERYKDRTHGLVDGYGEVGGGPAGGPATMD